ncbi:3-isopropylmalate dehydratase small subunit [Pleionea sediminis]|uniref:3-isopropylmalate dehydratase small subunit n=1 Tax=Pleionea sediminis TaxID=2569479 RepID=UPI001185FB27|nr:3-isopropylmalate dehydratase small subunit [Pleionea sediminis]
MEKFNLIRSIVAPIDRSNIDTDAIIPKQFLKSVKRSGFGPYLFDEWRYLDTGEPEMDCSQRPINTSFVLNQDEFKEAQVLLTRDNFGCGSSREHAPWALEDFGIRVIIASSFADIFFSNCFKNGILPLVLAEQTIDELFQLTRHRNIHVTVDLENQLLIVDDDKTISFEIDVVRKECLLEGMDDIDQTLQHLSDIRSFEAAYRNRFPWLF